MQLWPIAIILCWKINSKDPNNAWQQFQKLVDFFLPWIIWLTLIFCINLNFLVSSFCLLNHCVVKVVVAIIVYKRPMFINPWNGFSQDLDICSRYAASLLFQDVLIFFSWSIVLYISNVGTWTIRFWQQIVDDQTRIDLITVFSFLMLFSTWS